MFSNSIQQLIDQFMQLPSVGPRTATRYALRIAHYSTNQRKDFIKALENLADLQRCAQCNALFNSNNQKETLCAICRNKSRNHHLLCVVEKETDLNSIEKIQIYHGLYFIIGPTNNWSASTEIKKNIKQLLQRINTTSPKIEEVVLAFNSNAEGRALSVYLANLLQKTSVKITHLRQGLPRGGELAYADYETLQSAIKERKEV